jgi:hypothetical protein
MKTPYTFVTLRYVHDVVTGEFANVGVVLYAPEQRHLEARFTSSYERLNALFVKIDHANFRALIRHLSNRFQDMAAETRESLDLAPVLSVEDLVRRVLPQDDSSLQWSPAGGGFSSDIAGTVGQLYERMVERYTRGGEESSRSDEDVARPFRAKFPQKMPVQKELIAERDVEAFGDSVAAEIARHGARRRSDGGTREIGGGGGRGRRVWARGLQFRGARGLSGRGWGVHAVLQFVASASSCESC